MYRANGIDAQDLWNICSEYVDQRSTGRKAKARGTCLATVFIDNKLSFDADGKPHIRHVNVIDWPVKKDEQKLIQKKIAARMTLDCRPS